MTERDRRSAKARRSTERRTAPRRAGTERRSPGRAKASGRRATERRTGERRDGDRRGKGTRASGADGAEAHLAPAKRKITEAGRLDLILDVTRQLMSETDLTKLLQLIAVATTKLVDCDRATVFLIDRDKNEMWSKVALGASEIRFPVGAGIAGTVAVTGQTINIPDAYADPRFNQAIDKSTGYKTNNLLTFPMTGHDGRVIGVFQAVNKHAGPFADDDEAALSSLASSAAVCVENAQLVEGQRQLWTSLVETLAVTVDARDQQTAGHSRRVTRYAEVIAASMGMTPAEVERVRTAGLLHDYGKIAVRDRFLQKAGKLDDAEFAYMKAHAEKTGEFLQYLRFPPDMRDVPLMAAQHHERMDGKGYPLGLAGDQIHVGARIVAAADVFDALTAPRYYKPAYSIEKTLDIMRSMTGEHLDRAIMAAVEAALPKLIETLEELKPTWPKPGDEGMGSLQEASAQLSERDQARLKEKQAQPAPSGGAT
ncbi:MAG: HD domain-containing protein [Chloroflexi bacterium]|nr:HD domain-containing protein [Chloroflexota bacterium]